MMDYNEIANGKLSIRSSDAQLLFAAELMIETESVSYAIPLRGSVSGGVGSCPLTDVQLSVEHPESGRSILSLTLSPTASTIIKRLYFKIVGLEDEQLQFIPGQTRFFAYPSFFTNDDGPSLVQANKTHSSNLMSMILNDREENVLFGTAALPADYSFFELQNESFKFGFELNRPLPDTVSYKLLIAQGPDPMELLNAYGDVLSAFAVADTKPIQGWNSWDYYAQSITMDDICNEMRAIHDKDLKNCVEAVIIDYGWETSLGDFRPNGKFPASFKEIADEISNEGFVPGIWTAPLLAHMFSPIARHKQHLLTRRRDGNPVISNGNVALDFSHPEVQQHLFELYTALYDAGFRVFKIDYIYQDTIDQIEAWHDMSIGKAELIRIVFDIVRKAVGPESHVINCGAPVESCLGRTNSSRTSIDIHNFWGHIKNNARQTALRLWQNRKLWAIDPDFAIVRCRETSDDPYLNVPYTATDYKEGDWHWFAGEESGFEEMKVALSFTVLAAGNMCLSDSMPRLNALGIQTLRKLFPVLDASAVPVDLFENSIPRLWAGQKDGKALVGLFNFSDSEQPIYLPEAYQHLTALAWVDFWNGQRVALKRGLIQPAHSVLLLNEISDKDESQKNLLKIDLS